MQRAQIGDQILPAQNPSELIVLEDRELVDTLMVHLLKRSRKQCIGSDVLDLIPF